MLPSHLQRWQRWPSTEARQSLARRLELPYGLHMQDWEWEVADPERIPEFLATYGSKDLNDDERFSLMEILVQSVADRHPSSLEDSPVEGDCKPAPNEPATPCDHGPLLVRYGRR